MYFLSSAARFTNFAASESALLRFTKTSGSVNTYYYGVYNTIGTGSSIYHMTQCSATIPMSAGDTVQVDGWCTNSASFYGSTSTTWRFSHFSGHRLY